MRKLSVNLLILLLVKGVTCTNLRMTAMSSSSSHDEEGRKPGVVLEPSTGVDQDGLSHHSQYSHNFVSEELSDSFANNHDDDDDVDDRSFLSRQRFLKPTKSKKSDKTKKTNKAGKSSKAGTSLFSKSAKNGSPPQITVAQTETTTSEQQDTNPSTMTNDNETTEKTALEQQDTTTTTTTTTTYENECVVGKGSYGGPDGIAGECGVWGVDLCYGILPGSVYYEPGLAMHFSPTETHSCTNDWGDLYEVGCCIPAGCEVFTWFGDDTEQHEDLVLYGICVSSGSDCTDR